MTFSDYTKLVEDLLSQNKTTGNDHSETMIHFTKMNLNRIKRWIKKGELTSEMVETIQKIDKPQKWIILSEAWCGDTPVSIAFLYKISELNSNIKFQILLRDENLKLMDKYLTNGGRAIPKIIAFDENNKEIFNWGPRPKNIQDYVNDAKSKAVPKSEINIEIQKMYNEDKGIKFQKEILDLIH